MASRKNKPKIKQPTRRKPMSMPNLVKARAIVAAKRAAAQAKREA
jgi:hypothetical protein